MQNFPDLTKDERQDWVEEPKVMQQILNNFKRGPKNFETMWHRQHGAVYGVVRDEDAGMTYEVVMLTPEIFEDKLTDDFGSDDLLAATTILQEAQRRGLMSTTDRGVVEKIMSYVLPEDAHEICGGWAIFTIPRSDRDTSFECRVFESETRICAGQFNAHGAYANDHAYLFLRAAYKDL
ncbi:hypothetical protein KTR10_03600 [Candidatus Kaiserbacteria bacterium]|nr:hypothetical protein [Candidatus Kaiserbacteria bacterium]